MRAEMRSNLHTPRPTRRVEDGDVVRLAGREWMSLHTPGHTPDHLCLYDREHGVVLSGDHVRTVTVALQLFVGEFTVQWGLLTAGGTLVAIPVTILFLIVQKRLVSGLTAGAVKA